MKYTKEFLAGIACDCKSVSEVMRRLGLKPNGGNVTYLGKRMQALGVDTAHFLGQAANRGHHPPNRKHWSVLLVKNKKEKARVLTRALLESGRDYRCEAPGCVVGNEWNGKKLTLQVDHKDGDVCNNRPENVRFICPNCHTQTDNWGALGVRSPSGGMADP